MGGEIEVSKIMNGHSVVVQEDIKGTLGGGGDHPNHFLGRES